MQLHLQRLIRSWGMDLAMKVTSSTLEIAINAEFLNYRFAFGNFNMLPLKT